MSVSHHSDDGPKTLLLRAPPRYLDLVDDLAAEDDAAERDAAFATLRASGWSYRRIARALGTSPATVWRRVNLLESRMRQRFAA